MKEVEKEGVEEHDGCFEDPEIDFILIDGRVPALDVLHKTINASDRNDASADVHDVQHDLEVLFEETGFKCAAME